MSRRQLKAARLLLKLRWLIGPAAVAFSPHPWATFGGFLAGVLFGAGYLAEMAVGVRLRRRW